MEENLALTFSVPHRLDEGLYRVPVTAETDVEFELPVIGARAYTVALPFNIDVDIDARAVSDWSFDLAEATVE